MPSPYGVVDQAVRHVERVILILASGDRHSRLVTTQDDRTKDDTMISFILSQNVIRLQNIRLNHNILIAPKPILPT